MKVTVEVEDVFERSSLTAGVRVVLLEDFKKKGREGGLQEYKIDRQGRLIPVHHGSNGPSTGSPFETPPETLVVQIRC